MTLLLVFVGCLFTIFTLWMTISPFVGGAEEGLRLEHLDEEVREIELLVAQREVLVKALRELDFDRETDKLAPDDYERFRRRYENQAVAIMRRLDEIHGGMDWRERVEAELSTRLGRPSLLAAADDDLAAPNPGDDDASTADATPLVPEPDEERADDDGETPDESDASAQADDAEGTPCVSCGEPLAADDRFCSQCGTPVGLREATPPPVNSEASA